jgi:hypothetical protein
MELFQYPCIFRFDTGKSNIWRFHGMIKEEIVSQRTRVHTSRADDGLGPNTDIGSRLRALYGSVQDEGVPEQLLDLLEKLDSAEQAHKTKDAIRGGE